MTAILQELAVGDEKTYSILTKDGLVGKIFSSESEARLYAASASIELSGVSVFSPSDFELRLL